MEYDSALLCEDIKTFAGGKHVKSSFNLHDNIDCA